MAAEHFRQLVDGDSPTMPTLTDASAQDAWQRLRATPDSETTQPILSQDTGTTHPVLSPNSDVTHPILTPSSDTTQPIHGLTGDQPIAPPPMPEAGVPAPVPPPPPEPPTPEPPAEKPAPDPTDETKPDPADGTTPDPVDGTKSDPVDGTKPDPADGTTPDPADGTKPDPADGTTPDPADGTTPDPEDGTTPDPADGTTPDPADGTTPGPADGTDSDGTGTAPDGTNSGEPATMTTPENKPKLGGWEVDPERLRGFSDAVVRARSYLDAVQMKVDRMQGAELTPQLGTSPVGKQLAKKFDDRLNSANGLREMLVEAMKRMEKFVTSAEQAAKTYEELEQNTVDTFDGYYGVEVEMADKPAAG